MEKGKMELQPEQVGSALDVIVKASIPLIVVSPGDLEPEGFGSGCIVRHRERLFLLSVAHVTDYEGKSTCIITNQLPKDGKGVIYSVGAMCFFDEYKLAKDQILEEIQSLDDLLQNFNETLDVTFCEIKEPIELIQPETDFIYHKIEKGRKIIFDFDAIDNPDKSKVYGFSGYIRQEINPGKIESQITLKIGLTFHKTKGRFHMFLADKIIRDADDYRGCSGAPIVDEEGKLVALAASVLKNSQIVFGFSIHECKRLLDHAIETNLL
ncbi:hypothetical protein [Flavobacterium piscisymbiosum]|uniref:Trypsin-like peptidase domain-containing protein n=1 Tax=Flavobacterium piscisymbiosum TaxID=2893753 RepID=A0ABS8MDX2_9FLAO|nr:hypothetical protein [Flavobacterium sp. F-30]MCC9063719.1 hypothetical protein [Flavobacterium sp. F-30]